MTTSNLHVVFGTGPLGRSVVNELIRRGQRVRVVSRSGVMAEAPQGVELAPAICTTLPRCAS